VNALSSFLLSLFFLHARWSSLVFAHQSCPLDVALWYCILMCMLAFVRSGVSLCLCVRLCAITEAFESLRCRTRHYTQRLRWSTISTPRWVLSTWTPSLTRMHLLSKDLCDVVRCDMLGVCVCDMLYVSHHCVGRNLEVNLTCLDPRMAKRLRDQFYTDLENSKEITLRLVVTLSLWGHVCIYIYMCVCVCMCCNACVCAKVLVYGCEYAREMWDRASVCMCVSVSGNPSVSAHWFFT
jgi:hypothetical protein